MIDLFKKDLEVEIGVIKDSLNVSNYNLEQICILSFHIMDQKQGKISINNLSQRIVSLMNASIEINDAKTIATYIVNKYDSYTKLKRTQDSVASQSNHSDAEIARLHAERVAKQIIEGSHSTYGKGPTGNNTSQRRPTTTSSSQSTHTKNTSPHPAKQDNSSNQKKDWSGVITLAGVVLMAISLCYLLELRWGYTFLFLFGIFMLIGMMDSFYKKNSKLEEKVNLILFGWGGGILSGISLIIMFFFASPRYEEACRLDTIESYQNFINKHPFSGYVADAKANQKRLKKLATNRLEHGDQPYSYLYGSNSYYGRSAIKVVAPKNSDLVVLIKEDNSVGEVVAHAYLRSGCSYTFNLPNGTYQTFFYYGSGWNPKKKQGEVTGGFINNETFSKDNPQDLFDAELTYTLQLTTAGNFRTKGSSRGEIF